MPADHEIMRNMLAAINAVNDTGSFDAIEELAADKVSVIINDVVVASTKGEWLQALREANERGFVAQHHYGTSAHHGLVTTHYVNVLADGSEIHGAGVAAFDDQGKISAVRTVNLASQPIVRPPAA